MISLNSEHIDDHPRTYYNNYNNYNFKYLASSWLGPRGAPKLEKKLLEVDFGRRLGWEIHFWRFRNGSFRIKVEWNGQGFVFQARVTKYGAPWLSRTTTPYCNTDASDTTGHTFQRRSILLRLTKCWLSNGFESQNYNCSGSNFLLPVYFGSRHISGGKQIATAIYGCIYTLERKKGPVNANYAIQSNGCNGSQEK